ncbi:MazG family protein [Thioploca ingrica]|uniref:MazG family protein n=1 Tax=Thioploca ingrica TaxID=40754 RepID=A0A090AKJ2_9GAMM|nr:MazG family protein [Thioploca ingrica]
MTNLTADKNVKALQRLLSIMEELREQCPWNSKQTLESLRHLTIGKTDELSEAILAGNLEALKQKLGDLIWHVVFYSKIAAEQNAFDIGDVINGVCDKLVVHHPPLHTVASEAESQHHGNLSTPPEKDPNQSLLVDIQASLPALIKALRIQEQAHRIGFDWPNQAEVWEKVEEEIRELKQCQEAGHPQAQLENEWGDLLFSLVNYARFIHINPESALEQANRKFIKRFHYMEQAAQRDGKNLPDLSLAEMDTYWEAAKKNLN